MTDIQKEKEILVGEIYDLVLMTVNRILHNTKNYNISILKLENPSYSEIAKQLQKACDLMALLADDLPENGGEGNNHSYTVSKAREYTGCVMKIAEAITKDDVASLQMYRDDLDRRPFL